MKKILVADDHIQIATILKTYLVDAGFYVVIAHDGQQALDRFYESSYELVLLDVTMPIIDGFTVCRTIRETSNVPIIMVTARGDDFDRIMGLDLGADDYIVKPFVPGEVLARVRAILRRVAPPATQSVAIKGLWVDIDHYHVRYNDIDIVLTKKEIDILWTLMQAPNRVYTRDQLLDSVWGLDYFGDIRTVDSHIKRLRAKLPTMEDGMAIQTVWGRGYRFEVL